MLVSLPCGATGLRPFCSFVLVLSMSALKYFVSLLYSMKIIQRQYCLLTLPFQYNALTLKYTSHRGKVVYIERARHVHL